MELDEPQWPPREAKGHGQPQPISEDRVYHLPREAEQQIVLRAAGRVHNDEDRPIPVELRGLYEWIPGGAGGEDALADYEIGEVTVPAKSSQEFVMQLSGPVKTWAHNADQQSRGGEVSPHPAGEGFVLYADGRDCGVNVVYRLRISGLALKRVEDEADSWRLAGERWGGPPLGAAPVLAEHSYYLSKRAEIPLPNLDLAQE